MRRWLLAGIAVAAVGAARPADAESDNTRMIARCLTAAADLHRMPPAMLVVLLNVEGGELGHVSPNTNRTVDIGPMQINDTWLPELAAHWHASPEQTFAALRDNFCANVEAGAWILRKGLDEAHGDFWEGVGYYHSHDPHRKEIYLQAVLRQILRLREVAAKSPAHAPAPPVGGQ